MPLWDLELDKRLSNHWRVTITFDVFAADVEIALSCNSEDVVRRVDDGRTEERADQKSDQQAARGRRVSRNGVRPNVRFHNVTRQLGGKLGGCMEDPFEKQLRQGERKNGIVSANCRRHGILRQPQRTRRDRLSFAGEYHHVLLSIHCVADRAIHDHAGNDGFP